VVTSTRGGGAEDVAGEVSQAPRITLPTTMSSATAGARDGSLDERRPLEGLELEAAMCSINYNHNDSEAHLEYARKEH